MPKTNNNINPFSLPLSSHTLQGAMAQPARLPLAVHQAAERIGAAAQAILPNRAYGVPVAVPEVNAQLAGREQQPGESLSVLTAAFAHAAPATVAAATSAASAGAFILQQQQQQPEQQQQQ